MQSTWKTTTFATAAVAIALAGFIILNHGNGPAAAESMTLLQGRYQFIQFEGGAHFGIFDTDTGVLQEWTSKNQGDDYWVYDIKRGRVIDKQQIGVQ